MVWTSGPLDVLDVWLPPRVRVLGLCATWAAGSTSIVPALLILCMTSWLTVSTCLPRCHPPDIPSWGHGWIHHILSSHPEIQEMWYYTSTTCSGILVTCTRLPASCMLCISWYWAQAQQGRARWCPSAPPRDLLISSTSHTSGGHPTPMTPDMSAGWSGPPMY